MFVGHKCDDYGKHSFDKGKWHIKAGGLDIEKVAMLTGMVDKLVQMKHVDNALDESVVEELIQKALFISCLLYTSRCV